MRVRHRFLIALSAIALLAGCFAESGLKDEFRDATKAIDSLIDTLEDAPAIRDAAEEAKDAVDESQAALEAFRDDPSEETRQALEEAERHLNDARELLDGSLEDAPEAIRTSLGKVIDALERVRRQIRQELGD
jgi:ABC-type transporter Mla subunit MlaD